MSSFQFSNLLIDLFQVPRNDANVESLGAKLITELEADAIRASSDHSPCMTSLYTILSVKILSATATEGYCVVGELDRAFEQIV